MSNTSNICRDLLNTKDVMKGQISEHFITSLVSDGKISRDECKILSEHVGHCIDQQVDSLIDRILNESR
jgi:hypothetical protein